MKRKVDSGDTNSMAQYTKMLFQGDCVPVNKFELLKYFKKAAYHGDVEAIYIYGYMKGSGDLSGGQKR